MTPDSVSGTSRLSPHGDSGLTLPPNFDKFYRARREMLLAFFAWAKSRENKAFSPYRAAEDTYLLMTDLADLAKGPVQ